MASERRVAIIGAALDLGAGRRGVDMGPSAIRYAGLEERLRSFGWECLDRGNVETAVQEATAEHDPSARYLPEIEAACGRVARLVAHAVGESHFPLVLGGDHSVAMGTLGGMARVTGPGGVLWIDAHGDLNTPASSPSGNAWGMPLRTLIDSGVVRPENVALVGARALDPPEEEFLRSSRVQTGEGAPERALERADAVYVALDCDSVEPGELEVFMPEPNGLRLDELEALLHGIAARRRVAGAGLTGLVAAPENEPKLARLCAALGV